MMNKWKALLAAMIVVAGMTACNNAADENETNDTTVNDTVAGEETEAQETQRETYAPGEDKIILHSEVSLETEDTSLFTNGVNPYYDKENKVLVFAINREVKYEDELSCDLVATGSDLYFLEGTLVTDDYASLCTENGYRGAAIKLEEDIAPGTYKFNVNFSYYSVAFEMTIE